MVLVGLQNVAFSYTLFFHDIWPAWVYRVLVPIFWCSITAAVTKHNSWNSWKWTWWNSKTQQMFERRNRMRETKEIQFEATKILRVLNTLNFKKTSFSQVSCSDISWVLISGAEQCLLWLAAIARYHCSLLGGNTKVGKAIRQWRRSIANVSRLSTVTLVMKKQTGTARFESLLPKVFPLSYFTVYSPSCAIGNED